MSRLFTISILFFGLMLSPESHAQHFNWVEKIGLDGGGNDYGHDIWVEEDEGVIYGCGLLKNNSVAGSGSSQVSLPSYGQHDVYFVKYRSDGSLIWAKRYGGIDTEYSHTIHVDDQNNLYSTGDFRSTFILVDSTIAPVGSQDLFVIKMDTAGNRKWIRTFGGASANMYSSAHITAPDGMNYIACNFSGTITIGTQTFTQSGGYYDILLFAMDSTGQVSWAKQYFGGSRDEVKRMRQDNNGNIILCGIYTSSLNIGGNVLAGYGNLDAFIAKINPAGTTVWARSMGNTNNDWARGLAVDSLNNYYLAGNFQLTAGFSGSSITITSNGVADAYVAKYSENGNLQWAYSFGSDLGAEQPFDFDIDEEGDLYFAVMMTDYTVIGSDTLPLIGTRDWLIVKFDTLFNKEWHIQLPGYPYGGKDPSINRMCVDNCGYVYVTGGFLNTVYFEPVTLSAYGTASDVFIGKISPRPKAILLAEQNNFCRGDSLYFGAKTGCSFTSYQWNIEGYPNSVSGSDTCVIPADSAGIFDLQLIVSDGYHYDTLLLPDHVVIHSPPVLNINDTSVCSGNLITVYPGNFQQYIWQDGSTDSSFTAASSQIISIYVVDSIGCEASDTALISFQLSPEVDISDTTLCSGETLLVYPGEYDQYLWQDGSTDSVLLVGSPQTILVYVANSYGCEASDSATISFVSPTVNLGSDTLICPDDLLLSAGTHISYEWSDGSNFPDLLVSFPGTYFVEVADSMGCTASDTIQVDFYPVTSPALGNDTLLCNTLDLVLNAGVYSSYSWSDGSTFPDLVVNQTDTFWVTVTDFNNCISTDTIFVEFSSCDGYKELFAEDIKIHPVPADDQITISGVTAGSVINIYDLKGSEIMSMISDDNIQEIPVALIPDGVYMVSITVASSHVRYSKIVIQH